MSNSTFVKGECRHCAGHLEFPAEATGATITCPHCGQSTELVVFILLNKIKDSGRIWRGIGLAGCLVAAGLAAAFFFAKKSGGAKLQTVPSARTNVPAGSVPAPVVHAHPPIEAVTNEFALLPFKLEKTPGSSLVYVTGAIRNLSDRQRFGVKIEFELFDAKTNAVGTATDYQSVLDPHGEWNFKALVMESKAASARFAGIREDRQ